MFSFSLQKEDPESNTNWNLVLVPVCSSSTSKPSMN